MKALYDIKDILCEELEKMAKRKDLNPSSLDMLHKLTDTVKNIDKILMLEEQGYSEDGYSRDGHSMDGIWRANMEGQYGHGSSYRRRRDSMGRYSRDDGGMSRDGYSRDNYSQRGYSGDKGRILQMLESMMKHDAGSEIERKALEECIDKLNRG